MSKKQNSAGDLSPYFFLVGAGISMPKIMGANDIIEECKRVVEDVYCGNNKKFEELLSESETYKGDSSKYYSFWLETAYNNKIERQRYFSSIIKNAKISAAKLLLVQI